MKPANKLKIPTLTKEWCDKDYVLLHACFAILVEFVEKEWGGLDARRAWLDECEKSDENDWWVKECGNPQLAEVSALYEWWTKERLGEDDSEDGDYAKDTEMIMRLVSIRSGLWT